MPPSSLAEACATARRIDLHLHSDRSDGRFPFETVIERCLSGNLDFIAITDHDLTPPVSPGVIERDGRRVFLLGGAEISGFHADTEQHLLVYFPGDIPREFRELCQGLSRARAERYDTAVRRLGIDLPPADDAARSGERALTRHHLARAMIAAGHARDLREAFAGPLNRAHGRVPQVELPFVEAIRLARRHGGVTSWAHPSINDLARFLPDFAAAGLHAIEGIRPMLSSKERRIYRRAAEKHGLFLTGGSDAHGWHDATPGLFYVEPVDLKSFFSALTCAVPEAAPEPSVGAA